MDPLDPLSGPTPSSSSSSATTSADYNNPLNASTTARGNGRLDSPLSTTQSSFNSTSNNIHVPNLSPLGKRPPLGLASERTSNYRPQPLPPPPSTSAWGASPPTTPQPSNRDWNATGVTAPGHQYSQPSPTPNRNNNSGLTPRSPQAYSSPIRDRLDGDERRVATTNGAAGESGPRQPIQNGYVRIKIMGLEKSRRDVYVKFNAESNMPSFRNSSYRNVSRSYTEFTKFADVIAGNNPQSIIPALPLVQTSATTDDEDDRVIKANFQKWVARITLDGGVLKDDELRNFVEGEFGYTPNSRARRKTAPSGSTFSLSRSSRLPGEQDDDLTLAKTAMSKLELQFGETAKAVEKVARARRAAALAYVEVSEGLNAFAATEGYQPLAVGIKKLSKATKTMADVMAHQGASEMVTLGDNLNYQSINARSAKETLMGRDAIVEEHRTAVKATIAKKKAIEKLKSGSSIKADRVDEALEELDDAKRHEVLTSQRLAAISQNLQPSLRTHSIHAHQDILTSLLDHAASQLRYEKLLLKELELVRPELHAIKPPQAGVIYHASASTVPKREDLTPPRTSSVMGRGDSYQGTGSVPTSPSMGGGGSGGGRQVPPPVGRGGPNFAEGGPLSAGPAGGGGGGQSSMGGGGGMGGLEQRKRSIYSMAKSVQVADDRRQRVDAKMAASMLANGF